MKNIQFSNDECTGREEFEQIDMSTYTQRVFSMVGGQKKRVTIRSVSSLLDAFIERFGTQNAHYVKIDEHHFEVTAVVEVSEQFYGWLCGLGTRVKLVEPTDSTEDFKNYLKKLYTRYE